MFKTETLLLALFLLSPKLVFAKNACHDLFRSSQTTYSHETTVSQLTVFVEEISQIRDQSKNIDKLLEKLSFYLGHVREKKIFSILGPSETLAKVFNELNSMLKAHPEYFKENEYRVAHLLKISNLFDPTLIIKLPVVLRVSLSKLHLQIFRTGLISTVAISDFLYEIQYSLSKSEVPLMIEALKKEFIHGRKHPEKMGAFIRLLQRMPYYCEYIENADLRPLFRLMLEEVQQRDSMLRRHMNDVLWTLILVNSDAAKEMAARYLQRQHHLPEPPKGLIPFSKFIFRASFIKNYFQLIEGKSIDLFVKLLKTFNSPIERESIVTTAQLELQHALETTGVRVYSEYDVPGTHFEVDLFFQAPDGSKHIIELDGSQHYLVDENFEKILRPSDYVRDLILEKMGYEIRRYSNEEAAAITDALRRHD